MVARDSGSNAGGDPITPHAAPILDGEGRLTYIGDDGRRYVVGLPPDWDEARIEQVMARLRGGAELFQQIEQLSRHWLEQVAGSDLEPEAALTLLLTSLETALDNPDG
jgi:hypothetical protein